ncbi:SET domain [Macleaya cordata]|uniref:SET domain n=1 Tax=Macleaya cordata TaxID=56857 RepID=A0A200RB90_MACCD|nr:SET domain [Macleaya cordata]
MSSNPKVAMAFTAMKAIGISEKKVKPVLKNLLKLYDKNWALIEDENYRALADAIFEAEESKVGEKKKEVQLHDDDGDCGPPLKRLRLKHREEQASPSGETSLRKRKLEEADLHQNCSREEGVEPFQPNLGEARSDPENVSPNMHLPWRNEELSSPQDCSRDESEEPTQLHLRKKRSEPEPVSYHTHFRDKGKEPLVSPGNCHRNEREEPIQLCIRDNRAESITISPQTQHRNKGSESISIQIPPREKRVVFRGASTTVCLKEPKVEPGVDPLPKEKLASCNQSQNNGLISPKTEPCDNFPQFEVPIAVIHPPNPDPTRNEDPVHEDGNNSNEKADGVESLASQDAGVEDECRGGSGAACENGTSLELADIPETSPASVEIASSSSGEVKISLSCNYSLGQPNFHLPSPDEVLKMVEDKCLKSYKIIEPNFSLMNLMKELCQCFLDLASDSTDDKQENFIRITPNLDLLKKSNMKNSLGAKCDDQGTFHIPGSSLNGSLNFHSSTQVVPQVPRLLVLDSMDDLHGTVQPNENGNTNGERDKKMEQKDPGSSSSSGFVAVRHEKFTPDDISPLHDVNDIRPLHDVNDISKGEESVRISLVNEVSSEPYPPLFFYIPKNIIFRNAYVKFSLARIGDEDCCSNCFGDCMSSSIPCACARETGGDFAYTLEGLLKENFLDECISMNRDPQQNHLFYCKNCPLERCKNGDLSDPCKGHLMRKFIKECWSKCGCNKQCGNRVVQRGITCNLQVFLTAEGKGWGLRTLEDLPRGTFVCEYVGEILTNTELNERNMEINDGERQTYPVLLDAAWGPEGVLKDREALSLDATFYGNVARFINHRSFSHILMDVLT